MNNPIEINKVELVSFNRNQLNTQPFGTWDDNGGEPDGDMFLLPLSDVHAFDGMEVVSGYEVLAYSSPNNYSDWCGFSSRNVAYTTDKDTADAIALDEYGVIESSN